MGICLIKLINCAKIAKKRPLLRGVDPIFRLGVRGKVKDLRVSTNFNQLVELMIVGYRFKGRMQPLRCKIFSLLNKTLPKVFKTH